MAKRAKSSPKPRKKATAGERVEMAYLICDIADFRTSHMFIDQRDRARRIDAAIRRAVREAYRAGNQINNPSCSLKLAEEEKARIEKKYGVKL